MVGITDDTDPSPSLTQSPAAGTAITDGMTVTMTGEDAAGNSNSCSFKVNRPVDNTVPTIDCNVDLPGVINGILPDYTGLFTFSDDCDPNPTIAQSPAPGTAFDPAADLVITVTDAQGNWANCSFSDNAAPLINCPGDQTLVCGSTTIPDYTNLVTVTDFDPNPSLVQDPVPGSPFTEGMGIAMTATDAKGQASSCSFRVTTEVDTENPVITCPSDQTLAVGSTLPDYTGMVTVNDNCDPDPTLVQNPAAGSAYTSGMRITMTATDVSSNSENCSFLVTDTADTTPPTIVCDGDQTTECDTQTLGDYTSLVTVSDDRDTNPTV